MELSYASDSVARLLLPKVEGFGTIRAAREACIISQTPDGGGTVRHYGFDEAGSVL